MDLVLFNVDILIRYMHGKSRNLIDPVKIGTTLIQFNTLKLHIFVTL